MTQAPTLVPLADNPAAFAETKVWLEKIAEQAQDVANMTKEHPTAANLQALYDAIAKMLRAVGEAKRALPPVALYASQRLEWEEMRQTFAERVAGGKEKLRGILEELDQDGRKRGFIRLARRRGQTRGNVTQITER